MSATAPTMNGFGTGLESESGNPGSDRITRERRLVYGILQLARKGRLVGARLPRERGGQSGTGELLVESGPVSDPGEATENFLRVVLVLQEEMPVEGVTVPAVAAATLEDVLAALRREPLEEGFGHVAEVHFEEALEEDAEAVRRWLLGLLTSPGEMPSSLVADAVRLLGRVDPSLCDPWGGEVIAGALRSEKLAIRAAAVRTLEDWGRPGSVEVLRAHVEHETNEWLRRYARSVMEDLLAAGE